MTINEEIYQNLYDWADQVLNQERCLDMTIIKSTQNVPKPKRNDCYIVINYASNLDRIGRPYRTEVDDYGKRNLINDYVGILELREVNGDGEYLRVLIESLDRQEIQHLWSSNSLTHYNEGDILQLPRIQETNWKKEALVELTIGYSVATEDNTGLIETIEYQGTIPAQGGTGNHIIEN
jgi:hypothetical protein